MPKPSSGVLSVKAAAFLLLLLALAVVGEAQTPVDPGPRTGTPGAGGYVSGLTANQQLMEIPGSNFFAEVNNVAGFSSVKRIGLGARFDSNACSGCHAQPANGGSSLPSNPLFDVYQAQGALNTMPFFETTTGPTLVARMPFQSDLVTPDGHVHQLFTITGRTDAGTCNIQQPDFITAAAEGNLIFRNTTPFFGGGLLEIIQDSAIIANMTANLTAKMALGISGHPNLNGDDGSVNRFGWKAQKRSLILFAGEAYNVEVGISNEFFPNKTDETPGCTPPFPDGPPNGNGPHGVPDDRADYASLPTPGYLMPGDPERFSIFGRLLAPPTPATTCPNGGNCVDGQTQFNNVGCNLCHTQSFVTPASTVAAVGGQKANLFSDVLVHDMGQCDADNVTQGSATGDQFRTTPLWGVGQRYFFMHDARTNNIVQAIYDHSDFYSQNPPAPFTPAPCTGIGQYPASEANGVIQNFQNLVNTNPTGAQDLIDFLRSL